MSMCGIKRCGCEDEEVLDLKAVKHVETVITRWLRNDLGFGIDGHALAEAATAKFMQLQNAAWRRSKEEA